MKIDLYNSECLEKLKSLPDDSIDAVVTDPPYGLSFMGKKWDYDVPSVAIWEECLRVLKPGGYVLAFSSSRTYHRMAVRVEDAGFEIRDQLMWIYGSGFPKSHNIGKAIDKLQGKERKIIGENKKGMSATAMKTDKGWNANSMGPKLTITKGSSDWEGWGSALKPAHEPIVMARKPLGEKSLAENILKWGTGGINIDACRIGFDMEDKSPATNPLYRHQNADKYKQVTDGGKQVGVNVSFTNSMNPPSTEGRFPANIILDEEAGKILDEQSGTTKTKADLNYKHNKTNTDSKIFKSRGTYTPRVDEGGASRFFHCVGGKKVINRVRTIPVHSTDKKEDKTMFGLHPTIQHERVETTLGRFPANIILDEEAGKILDNQAPQVGSMFKATRKKETSGGSGDSWTNGGKEVGEDNGFYDGLGGASRFFYCAKVSTKERNKGCDDLEKKDKAGKGFRPNHGVKAELGEDGNPYGRWGKIANNHPTVKPIALMEYLIKLVSKEEATILDPFMGSGSTGIAAKRLNRNFVGIEMDEGYYTIAEKRIGK